ncbi:hypothetical protein CHCC20372_4302 [Bacillus paralicheniformis]|nr:hypothetical protein CHCC20372_4302 [Bacillus paralicheniformis]
MKKYTMNEMVHLTKNMLNERGVTIEDIALIVQKLQEKYHPICRLLYALRMSKRS